MRHEESARLTEASNASTLRIDAYDWAGGREALLRFGPDTGPLVIAALPLFEEANRTRGLVVTILRMLVHRGISGVLPDLPGTGESLIETRHATIATMRDAYRALAETTGADRRVFALGIRSGAMLDTSARLCGRWHLAPQAGTEVLHGLSRISRANGMTTRDPRSFAGNTLSHDMIAELEAIVDFAENKGCALRTVRLETDPRAADAKVAGLPLWRRAEPGHDPVLAQELATDIAAWIATCER